jgi:teichuronic acid exporter
MSVSDLGVYNLIKQLVLKVYGLLNPIIVSVSVPLLANFRDNIDNLKTKYMQMLQVISFINFGIYGLMILLAKETLIIFYGTTYQGSFLILQILCIWGSFSAVTSGASSIIIIKGRTDLGFSWAVLRILINPIFIISGSFFGFMGIVLGQTAFSIIFFPVYWKLIINRILKNISFKEFFSNVLPFLSTNIITISVLYAVGYFYLYRFLSYWLNIIVLGICFWVIYLLINKRLFTTFLNIIKKM